MNGNCSLDNNIIGLSLTGARKPPCRLIGKAGNHAEREPAVRDLFPLQTPPCLSRRLCCRRRERVVVVPGFVVCTAVLLRLDDGGYSGCSPPPPSFSVVAES